MSVRVLALTLTVIALGACSSGSTSPSTSNTTTSAASSTEITPTPTPTPSSSTPTTEPGPDLSGLKTYGTSSPECAAISSILAGATTIGAKANTGKVTQADLDATFTADAIKAVPAAAAPLVDAMQAVSSKVVGMDATAALEHLPEFSTALGNLTDASMKICG